MNKGISIHIGLEYFNEEYYGDRGYLPTSKKDAMDMYAIAQKESFESIVLLNEKATRDRVIEEIAVASKKLFDGDYLLITYSGHGSYILNDDSNYSRDETWCLYDGFLLDDELYSFWSQFQEGVRICLVSDSCHSGTISKSISFYHDDDDDESSNRHVIKKLFPLAKARRVYLENKAFYMEIKKRLKGIKEKEIYATVKLIAGCQDEQSAYILPHANNSLLTDELKKIWNKGKFFGTSHQFFAQLKKSVQQSAREYNFYQSPNFVIIGKKNVMFYNQKPFEISEIKEI